MTLKVPGEGKDEPRVTLSPAVLARLIQAAPCSRGTRSRCGFGHGLFERDTRRPRRGGRVLRIERGARRCHQGQSRRLGIANVRAFAGRSPPASSEAPFDLICERRGRSASRDPLSTVAFRRAVVDDRPKDDSAGLWCEPCRAIRKSGRSDQFLFCSTAMPRF